ncbi:uncharacterized protein LOC116350350 [Contarinia nasturtii]|uniref:uncharacterized protein LOC116350350 n=1 Tax=Contarinia nasturtii TaxID=265458 RepID=UPI0012D45CF5|nr:uncharacterized protein LOC116350350 [Contarinia nasturtii]XP_031637978.1 uncharacterized protein LOC116350350 [Contarinia nasturtii]
MSESQNMSEEDRNTSEMSQTEFNALNNDCILHILDWLSIKELATIKMTCKRLYLLANEHFCRTYKNGCVHLEEMFKELDISVENKYSTSFKYYMPKIHSANAAIETFNVIGQKTIQPIKYLRFFWANFNQNNDVLQQKYVKDVLKNVEIVNIHDCSSIDCLLRNCTKLEYLVLSGVGSKELLHTYPTLKQLQWGSANFPVELKEFLMRNRNIRALSTSNDNTIKITNWLLDTEIKLDDLVLKISITVKKGFKNMKQIIESLHLLHKNQQIKALHLKIMDSDFLLHPNWTEPEFLESIHIDTVDCDRKLVDVVSRMVNLKFLFYYNRWDNINQQIGLLAQKLTKLEELHIVDIFSIDKIIPFVQNLPKLQIIYVKCFRSGYINFANEINITLQSLDKDRRKLKNPCKLTIYVNENWYLQIKSNSMTNSYGLVEVKRTDSYPLSKHPIRPNFDD